MVWKHNPTIGQRDFDGAVVLVDPEKALLHELNEVGSRIWALCDGKLSSNEMAEVISEEYEVTPEQAHKDIEQFTQQMKNMGLLVHSGSQQ